MKRGLKGLSVLLSIIMVFCLFAPHSVYADETPADGENTTPAGTVISGGEEGTSGTTPSAIDGDGEEGGEEGTSGTTPSAIDGDGEEGDEEGTSGTTPSAIDEDGEDKEGDEEGTSGTTPSAIDGDGEEGDEDGTSGTTPSAIDGDGEDKEGDEGNLQMPMLAKAATSYKLSASVNNEDYGWIEIIGEKSSYNEGDTVTIVAHANTGYKFAGWHDDGDRYGFLGIFSCYNKNGNRITVTMKGDDTTKTVTAKFERYEYWLNASVVDEAGNDAPEMGSVDTEFAAGDRHSDTFDFDFNEKTVIATENPGYEFVRWDYTPEKHCTFFDVYKVNGKKIEVVFGGSNKNKSVKAVFRPLKYNVSATVTPASTGTVQGVGIYATGSNVTLTATPNNSSEYIFKQWNGDLPSGVSATDAEITFKMPAKSISLEAEFEQLVAQYDVTVAASPADAGTVAGGGKYAAGSDVTVSATPGALQNFDGWYDGDNKVSVDLVYTFKVERNIDLTAKFSPNPGEDEPVPPGYAIIRDFHVNTHPKAHVDFDLGVSGSVITGLVNPKLGDDGNPVRSSLKPSKDSDDIKGLPDWYENVPGTNYGIHYKMDLTDQGNGFYGFSSNEFFPIDGQGFGNEGNNHNYHFTLEYETTFQYDPAKASIKVASDDDLWIFINGKLAVDLGGHHSAVEQTFDLSNTNVFEGMKASDECTFKLFFAERNVSDSELSFKANFLSPYNPTQYTLNTEAVNGTITPVSGTKYNAGTVVEIGIVPDSDYEFDRWENGDGYTVPKLNSESKKYEVTMDSDIYVKAYFKPLYVTPTSGAIYVSKDVVGEMLDIVPQFASKRSMGYYEDIDDNMVFTVTLTGSAIEEPITATISEGSGAEFTDLPFGTYYLVETLLPGYERVDDLDNYTEIILDEEYYGAEVLVVNRLVKHSLFTEAVNGIISPASTEGLKYTIGSVVELNILPNSGYEFDRWENSDGYTVPTLNTATQKYEVTMSSDIHVKVYFKAVSTPPTISVTPVTEDSGSYTLLMAVVGQGTVLPGVGVNFYSKGAAVQLSATPAEGWKFDGWQGDTVDASNQIRMDSNKSVTAVFSQIATIVNDEPTPQAQVSEPQIVEMDDEETPAAPADTTALPKTGGVPATVFYGLGGFIAAIGVSLRSKIRKKKEEE